MKFIHCADLHLDSKLESNIGKEKAKERRNEILLTFERIVQLAKKEEVTAVLIAGDLFDTKNIAAKARNLVWDMIVANPEIDFLYLRGNHDWKTNFMEGRTMPENFKCFGTDWVEHQYGKVSVWGKETMEDDANYAALMTEPDRTNIVMLHGQEVRSNVKDDASLVALPALKNRNIDYLALGHIHSYKKEKLDDRGEYCYSGCPEGRGFDECGEKGVVMLEVKDGKVDSRFVPMASRILHEIRVDITGQETATDILRAVDKEVANILSKDMVKIVLTGHYTVDTEKDFTYFDQAMEGRFYFLKWKDESRLSIDYKSYENMISLKGEFVRTVMNAKEEESEKEQMILLGIRALSGEDLGV
ncbi:MAG: DNA repair exonuclease [Lachnospiraceae bacterium]|nr:DNA repair exonuclease [Lachnospiraceae bacterium]